MPTAPQIIDIIAPVANANAVYPRYWVSSQITTNIMITKIPQIKYYCFKNYIAPYILSYTYLLDFLP